MADETKLWAKSQSSNKKYHSGLHHMLDSGLICRNLINLEYFQPHLNIIQRESSLSIDDIKLILPFIVSMHDIGKVSPRFQGKSRNQEDIFRTINAGFSVPPNNICEGFRHDLEGKKAVDSLLGFFPKKFLSVIKQSISAHHGEWGNSTKHIQDVYDGDYQEARKKITQSLYRYFVGDYTIPEIKCKNTNTLMIILYGFIVLSDWLASNSDFMIPEGNMPFHEYLPIAINRAKETVNNRKFDDFLPQRCGQDILESLSITNPRPMQEFFSKGFQFANRNSIITIIEGPTGEGKTETAIAAALQHPNNRGIYFALPTIATSNQMFSRMLKLLDVPSTKLINSKSFIYEKDLRENVYETENTPIDFWIDNNIKSLLSSVGIGTIDQIMVGCLSASRHAMLRMFFLVGKSIVMDEIHSYDFYMSSIIYRFIENARNLDISIIMLSATLSDIHYKELIRSCGIERDITAPLYYPRITIIDEDINIYPVDTYQDGRTIDIYRIGKDSIAEEMIVDIIDEGNGCGVYIVNTVSEAQESYEKIRDLCSDKGIEVYLLHARFLDKDRKRIEENILDIYSSIDHPKRNRSILVSTQIIEQSLDVDFDVEFSQICPIDSLLQRCGRVWRKPQSFRNSVLNNPTLYIFTPSRYSSLIYDKYILNMTYRVMSSRNKINIPSDIRSLIDDVYCDTNDIDTKEYRDYKNKKEKHKNLSSFYLFGKLSSDYEFYLTEIDKIEPDIGEESAFTRLAQPSVRVIITDKDISHLTYKEAGKILSNSVVLVNKSIVDFLKNSGDFYKPTLWKDSAILSDYYQIILDEENGFDFLGGDRFRRLILDDRLGVVIS